MGPSGVTSCTALSSCGQWRGGGGGGVGGAVLSVVSAYALGTWTS